MNWTGTFVPCPGIRRGEEAVEIMGKTNGRHEVQVKRCFQKNRRRHCALSTEGTRMSRNILSRCIHGNWKIALSRFQENSLLRFVLENMLLLLCLTRLEFPRFLFVKFCWCLATRYQRAIDADFSLRINELKKTSVAAHHTPRHRFEMNSSANLPARKKSTGLRHNGHHSPSVA